MKTITVPAADEFLARLRAIDDEPYADVFYRLLLPVAGLEQAGAGVANRLVLAWADYTAGHATTFTQVVAMRLHTFVPAFTDDPQIQSDALDHLKAAGFPDGRD